MHDNKVRLSADVLAKAEQIAAEWGLKNARAAVEAVFRTYCDAYCYGRGVDDSPMGDQPALPTLASREVVMVTRPRRHQTAPGGDMPPCEALDALDQLLAL